MTQSQSPPHPRDIAEGLTEPQYALLLSLPTYAVESYAPALRLIANGLAERTVSGRLTATPLGEQVRSILMQGDVK